MEHKSPLTGLYTGTLSSVPPSNIDAVLATLLALHVLGTVYDSRRTEWSIMGAKAHQFLTKVGALTALPLM